MIAQFLFPKQPWGMDTRPLKVCCGICHQDATDPVKCKVGPPWIGLVFSDPKDAWLDWDVRNLNAKSTSQDLLLCFSNHSWTIFALWQGTSSCWKRPEASGNTISMKGYKVAGTCQSNIHMNSRTQGFPAAHCPESIILPVPACSLPIVHLGVWCSPGKRHTHTWWVTSTWCKRKYDCSAHATFYHCSVVHIDPDVHIVGAYAGG